MYYVEAYRLRYLKLFALHTEIKLKYFHLETSVKNSRMLTPVNQKIIGNCSSSLQSAYKMSSKINFQTKNKIIQFKFPCQIGNEVIGATCKCCPSVGLLHRKRADLCDSGVCESRQIANISTEFTS